jgi:hypothetical protein
VVLCVCSFGNGVYGVRVIETLHFFSLAHPSAMIDISDDEDSDTAEFPWGYYVACIVLGGVVYWALVG